MLKLDLVTVVPLLFEELLGVLFIGLESSSNGSSMSTRAFITEEGTFLEPSSY